MSKKGDSWASVTIEDLEGGIEVMVFPGAYQLAMPVLIPDTIVVVKGRIRRKDDGVELNALEVTLPAMDTGRPGAAARREPAGGPLHDRHDQHRSSRSSRLIPACLRCTCA